MFSYCKKRSFSKAERGPEILHSVSSSCSLIPQVAICLSCWGLNMQPFFIHGILRSYAPLHLQASIVKRRFAKSNIRLCVQVLGK